MLTLLNRPCFNTFSVPVVYTPSLKNGTKLAGTPINLMGIFDEKRETISLMGGGDMDAVIPRSVLEIRIADLGTNPMAGDDVSINGVPYRVLEVQPDGMGLAVLMLNRQQDPFAGL
ncbi:MAG TPA: hypothetical protein DCS88_00835 [Alphaproteobacteria bacterium]|nr:hypothetical protein [Alphaproteobacteria bacterium]